MSDFFTTRNILRLITLIAWVVAILWYLDSPSFEPLLAVVTGLGTLITSFFVDKQPGGIRMKDVRAGRHVKATDKTSQGIDAENIEAGQDVTLDEE